MKVEILIQEVDDLTTKTRVEDVGMITTIKFDAKVSPSSIARLLNLQRQRAPIMVTIGSPQAVMDLEIEEHQLKLADNPGAG